VKTDTDVKPLYFPFYGVFLDFFVIFRVNPKTDTG